MTPSLSPGPRPATPADLLTAQDRDHLLRTELPRVRGAAAAWRNGLGGLLATLIGFSLVKGRSDIGQLAHRWAALVGVQLLISLVAGAVGALLLIRAAHGRPAVSPTENLPPRRGAEHFEALASAAALRRGIASTLLCAAFLVAAVATTWYGPARDKPALEITTPSGLVCGTVIRIDHGVVTLKTNAGEVPADMSTASAVRAVTTCR
ncbi:hypothetical protein [Streptomyces sp. NPDC007205]|uniref:hypothetical protein n=1 Tax=Streptomyces sp. NPDC007205 TaxID=3154316 RepID=UPI0033FBB6C2